MTTAALHSVLENCKVKQKKMCIMEQCKKALAKTYYTGTLGDCKIKRVVGWNDGAG